MTIGAAMAGDVCSVRDLMDSRAADQPGDVYLIAPEARDRLSFHHLRRCSVAIAHLLAGYGLRPGERVATLLPNGAEAVAMFVGTMAAGCVVTPLSLLARPNQLAHVIQHSECRLVVASPETAQVAFQAVCRLNAPVTIHVLDAVPDGEAAEWPFPPPSADGDALLMYTSGTTGTPKGVRLSHRNVLSGARFVSEAHGLGPADRVLAVLPLYHINAQIVTVLAPLFHGGSLVMPTRFSAGAFWRLAAEHRCTWLNVVPTIIAYLLNDDAPSLAGQTLSAVRFCRSASAPLAPEHHRAFEARFGIGIVETMGLTETAAQVFANPLPPIPCRIGSPGRAFGNKARIVDPLSGRPLATGLKGEIQIRGPNVMTGYHENPVETARAITRDGWLRTGDLGYCDSDGFFFVTGRLKELIIKGGENISPREIDETLLRHPAVLEAAAVGVPDSFYGQDIEAAVVVKPGAAASEAELRGFCEQELGRFRTPRTIRFLDELPKGPSGKVQRLHLLAGNGNQST